MKIMHCLTASIVLACSAGAHADDLEVRTAIEATPTTVSKTDSTTPNADAVPAGTANVTPATAAETAALAAQLRARFFGQGYDYPTKIRPDGTPEKQVGHRHLNFRMARVRSDGTLETVCVDGADQALRFVEHGTEVSK